MYPQKQDPSRGFANRERKRKESRRLAAAEWQKEDFFQEEKMNASYHEKRQTNWTPLIVVLVVIFCLATSILAVIWNPFGFKVTRSLTTPPAVVEKNSVSLLPTAVVPVNPTEAPVVAADPTEIPVVPTEIPVVVEPTQVPVPVAVTCDTPFIDASLDNGQTWESKGLFLDTVLGKRMTFTSRSLLVPEKEWNVELSSAELTKVEETWQTISLCVPEGTFARIFAGGFEQKLNHLDSGVVMTLKPGLYEFKLRNGEIVLWYPQQEDFAAKDLDRIIEQIKFGNFDIKSALAFFGVTGDILPKIPSELVRERNVQVIPSADPIVK